MQRWLGARGGNVVMNVALSMPLLIAMIAMGVEWGNAEYVRNRNQRVADAAALAAAVAFNATGNQADMLNAARRTVQLNNLPTTGVTTTLVTSPSDASRNAVRVRINETVPKGLTNFVLGWYQSQDKNGGASVNANAMAELISQAANCIVALDGASTGVQVSGGANITANNCGVASQAQVSSANCGAYIRAGVITYNTNLVQPSSCGGASVFQRADGTALTPTRRATTDPYSANTTVSTARARLSTARNLTGPTLNSFSFPSSGTNINFDYTTSATTTALAMGGCTAVRVGNTWNFNCLAGNTRTFNRVTISGGLAVTFNVGTNNSGAVLEFAQSLTGTDRMTFGPGTYTIRGNLIGGSGGITFNGNTLNVTGFVNPGNSGTSSFGPGTYNISQGIFLNGSLVSTFGAGTYNIGRATIACGGGNYSLCIQSSGGATFAGPSTFNLPGGLRTGGGASITLGTGTANAFNIGASSDGYAFRGDGGARTILGDSSGGTNVQSFAGNVNLTGGGSCLVFGTATHHDIRGNLWATGAMWLNPGQYTVSGSVNFGGSGGGDSNCNGRTIGLYADGVTIVIGADSAATSGDCNGTAFCLAAGYSNVRLRPPASGSLSGFAVIGPELASNNRGGTFTSGATNTVINGVFYMPNGPLVFSGGARTGDAGGCLELLGRSVTTSAGGLLGSSCSSSGGAATMRVRIVQ